jgi:uncharacterized protein YbjT (DUF2867 family)
VSDPLFVVTGASGNIGRRLAALLLEGRRRVRVVGRHADRLRPLAEQGAHLAIGDVHDANFLREAFAGAHAAFTMLPTPMVDHDLRGWQNRASEAIAYGLAEARVPFVVNLSSIGAEAPYGTGPIAGLHDHEERLDRLDGVAMVHLRPAFFMENHLHAVAAIRAQGLYSGTLLGTLPMPMIATADIAQEAARLLAGLEFGDKSTRELLGARDYTMSEAAAILGAAIGKPDLPYHQATDEQAREAMAAHGMPSHMIDMMLEMNRAFNSGKVGAAEPRLPENTTGTTLEDWAAHFAAAYHHHEHPHPHPGSHPAGT